MTRLRWSRPPLVDVLCVADPPRWRALGLSFQTYRDAVRHALEDMRQADFLTAMRTANDVGRRLQGAGMMVQIWARLGDPADEIVTLIRNEHPDLAIVIPRGRRGPLLRSPTVTEQVIRRAEIATLVARGAAGEGGLPEQILLVLTHERFGEYALRWLSRAGWLRDSRVTLLALTADAGPPEGEDQTAAALGAAGPISKAALARLTAVAASEARPGGVNGLLARGGPAIDRLAEILAGTPTDLVVAPHPRPGQRYEPTEALASAFPCSVLVLPLESTSGDRPDS
jgi:nucleotide-binding universal stress UspA family protein